LFVKSGKITGYLFVIIICRLRLSSSVIAGVRSHIKAVELAAASGIDVARCGEVAGNAPGLVRFQLYWNGSIESIGLAFKSSFGWKRE
jgi:hypothetical protein